jgi:DNA invertase Pin-like site-specific DNA recombinase
MGDVSIASTVVEGSDTKMASGKFVAYYRVSTDGQGKSGLGLEAQRHAVTTYLNGGSWTLVGQFTEIESGRNADRPKLQEALAMCRAYRAALVVANVSRLTRSVAFLSKLLEANVEIRFVDLPSIEGATGRFILQQMASVAELEAGMIGERTKRALAAAKARGQKLGGFRGYTPTAEDGANGRKARSTTARARAADLAPIVTRLDPDGSLSLRALAAKLTAEGLPTPAGAAVWTAATVARVRAKLAA